MAEFLIGSLLGGLVVLVDAWLWLRRPRRKRAR